MISFGAESKLRREVNARSLLPFLVLLVLLVRLERYLQGRATASQKFEAEAQHWEASGELGWSGLNDYGYTKLRFWLGSEGAFADRVSDLLWEYGLTVEKRLAQKRPGWFDTFMRTRDLCSVRGESFSLGNLSFCTHCDAPLGYCHQFTGGRAANGNPKCP